MFTLHTTREIAWWKRLDLWKISVFTTIVVVILGGLYVGVSFTNLSTIKVIADEHTKPLVGLHDISGGLVFINEEEISQVLEKRNPNVERFYIRKEYPATLVIYVDERDAYATLTASDGQFAISREGVILEKFRSHEDIQGRVIEITTYQKPDYSEYAIGEQLDDTMLQTALFFSQKAQELGLSPTSIDIAGFHMIALQIGSSTIRFSPQKPHDVQLYQVDAIVRDLAKKGKRFASIDVRFEKPVLELHDDSVE